MSLNWTNFRRSSGPVWVITVGIATVIALTCWQVLPLINSLTGPFAVAVVVVVVLLALVVQWIEGLFSHRMDRFDWPWAGRRVTLWIVAALVGMVFALWMQNFQTRVGPAGSLQFVCNSNDEVPSPSPDSVKANKSRRLAPAPVSAQTRPVCAHVVGIPGGWLPTGATGRADHSWVQCLNAEPSGVWRCQIRGWLNSEDARLATCGKECSEAVKRGGPDKKVSLTNSGGTEAKAVDSSDKPWDTTNFIATVMAVVLAVVTLVATKTAADARNDVREEVERFGAARSARHDALVTRINMFSTIFLAFRIDLSNYYGSHNPSEASDAKRLSDYLRPLISLLSMLPSFGHPVLSLDQLQTRCHTLLNLQQANPLGTLPEAIFPLEMRARLRQTGDLVFQFLEALRNGGNNLDSREEELWHLLCDVARKLVRV